MKLTMENVLSYDKTFGKHKVGAVIGYTIEKTDWVQSAMSKKISLVMIHLFSMQEMFLHQLEDLNLLM